MLHRTVASDVFGSTVVRLADGSECDIGGEWAQMPLFGAVSDALGEEINYGLAENGVGCACRTGQACGGPRVATRPAGRAPSGTSPTRSGVREGFTVDTSPLTMEH